MAAELIPVRSDLDDYSITVDLGGKSYGLRFAWNTRDGRWMMDIRDSSGTALKTGLPVIVNTPLNGRFADSTMPDGYLIALDTSGDYQEIEAQEDFGGRVKLLFIPSEDF